MESRSDESKNQSNTLTEEEIFTNDWMDVYLLVKNEGIKYPTQAIYKNIAVWMEEWSDGQYDDSTQKSIINYLKALKFKFIKDPRITHILDNFLDNLKDQQGLFEKVSKSDLKSIMYNRMREEKTTKIIEVSGKVITQVEPSLISREKPKDPIHESLDEMARYNQEAKAFLPPKESFLRSKQEMESDFLLNAENTIKLREVRNQFAKIEIALMNDDSNAVIEASNDVVNFLHFEKEFAAINPEIQTILINKITKITHTALITLEKDVNSGIYKIGFAINVAEALRDQLHNNDLQLIYSIIQNNLHLANHLKKLAVDQTQNYLEQSCIYLDGAAELLFTMEVNNQSGDMFKECIGFSIAIADAILNQVSNNTGLTLTKRWEIKLNGRENVESDLEKLDQAIQLYEQALRLQKILNPKDSSGIVIMETVRMTMLLTKVRILDSAENIDNIITILHQTESPVQKSSKDQGSIPANDYLSLVLFKMLCDSYKTKRMALPDISRDKNSLNQAIFCLKMEIHYATLLESNYNKKFDEEFESKEHYRSSHLELVLIPILIKVAQEECKKEKHYTTRKHVTETLKLIEKHKTANSKREDLEEFESSCHDILRQLPNRKRTINKEVTQQSIKRNKHEDDDAFNPPGNKPR